MYTRKTAHATFGMPFMPLLKTTLGLLHKAHFTSQLTRICSKHSVTCSSVSTSTYILYKSVCADGHIFQHGCCCLLWSYASHLASCCVTQAAALPATPSQENIVVMGQDEFHDALESAAESASIASTSSDRQGESGQNKAVLRIACINASITIGHHLGQSI